MQDRRGAMAGHEQDSAGRAVPVAEAAAHLGLTPETLRKRLWRGQVPGEKRDGQWYVILAAPLAGQDGAGPRVPEQDCVQDTAGQGQDNEQDDAGPAALVAELRDRVAFLEAELARRDEEIAAWHDRLREAHLLLAQRPALPAPPPPNLDGAVQMQSGSNFHAGVKIESASDLYAGVQMQTSERTTCNPAPAPWWRRLLEWRP